MVGFSLTFLSEELCVSYQLEKKEHNIESCELFHLGKMRTIDQETAFQIAEDRSRGQKDPLEKEMKTRSSILA